MAENIKVDGKITSSTGPGSIHFQMGDHSGVTGRTVKESGNGKRKRRGVDRVYLILCIFIIYKII